MNTNSEPGSTPPIGSIESVIDAQDAVELGQKLYELAVKEANDIESVYVSLIHAFGLMFDADHKNKHPIHKAVMKVALLQTFKSRLELMDNR